MFSEERLDLGYDYGTVVTITTKTTVIERGNGAEQRTVDWQQPLLTFAVGQYSTINEQLETFIAFHRARKGALEGFRFKDWSDHAIVNQFLANGDGLVAQFQLYKTYSVNSWVAHRPITKPVEDTVRVFLDSVELTEGWAIDTTTGILTFEEAPTGEIRFSCEFDVPVRFATDEIRLRFEAYEPSTGNKIYNWENLTLQEVRLPHGTIPTATIPQDLNHQINLGYDYGTVGGAKFSTRIESLTSAQEVRRSNWSNPKAQWEIGDRSLVLEELRYLIALFRVARGRSVRFSYLDRADGVTYPVRFGEDSIGFRFDAFDSSTGAAIFNLAGLPLVGLPVFPTRQFRVRTQMTVRWRDLATGGRVIVNVRRGIVTDILNFFPLFGIPYLNWETVQDGLSYWGFQYGQVSDGENIANVGIASVRNEAVELPEDLEDLTNNFQQTLGIRCEAICESVVILSVVPV